MGSPIAGIAFINAVVFGAFGQAKMLMVYINGRESLSTTDIALSGALAGIGTLFFQYSLLTFQQIVLFAPL